MTTAPVCPTSQSQPIPVQMGLLLPVPALATDLPSVIRAINQLTQMILAMLRIPVNNVYPPQTGGLGLGLRGPPAGGAGASDSSGGKPPKLRWQEVSRTTERVRIHNPDDSSQYVDIDRISQVVFGNTVGTILTWNLYGSFE